MLSLFSRILIAFGFIALLTTEAILLNPNKPRQGFMINTKGDTIFCTLKNVGTSDVKYKTTSDSAYRPLEVTLINEYDIPKKHLVYRAIIVPKGIIPVFMPRIDSGKINLYVLYERVGKSTLYTFMHKNHRRKS